MPVQQKASNENAAVTRTDLVRLLLEVGRPEQLDVSGQDVRGINLMNCNLKGANLSQARVCEANLCGANLSMADLHGADLHGTYLSWADLQGADLCGADLSWASHGKANSFERTRSHLRRRGAIFREKTNVIVAERFSEKVGRYALGFALGLLCMSVVGFLMVVGIRAILTQMRLNRHPVTGLSARWDHQQSVEKKPFVRDGCYPEP
jgi:uncharacterized protein YjbI with pentapeptide repeats